MSRDVLLIGAVRTPNGRYGGSLRQTGAVDLGVLAAREAVARAGLGPELVEEVVLANCRQAGNGPNPGRQVSLRAGFPREAPAQTINMACASGLKAVQLARQSILSGEADVAVAVAAESMSTMPYLAPSSLRWGGVRRGDIVLADGWRDGGTDPVCGLNMGQTAENIAERFGVSRADQDAWSLRSHQRVATAWAEGRFAGQVVDVPLEDGDVLDRDEGFRTDTTAERLARLKPSFVQGGTVTAGNASQMADGAAAVVLASADVVAAHGLTALGRMRSFSAVGVDPAVMGVGPASAIPRALEAAGVKTADLDLVEINEAFAAQVVHNVRALDLDEERVNVNGGGIALGHPTGQSGCRLVVSLLHELARRDQSLGVASLCVGGGQGVAAVIERVA
ncbi:acetyl-CoA C-acetyltransferase [Amycolatopsis bartoniae]|uniref:Probable acetyl-CoA acetyltransferase n=1 Tax=Amycolatopsis bartoniae TaxID=941986 RepID=A0A8H9IRK2_9PSEU|nr:thiolase family protein [Amycolatopsis bartoniae]MBB2937874.1 acetyl-CoA C-acetyltransferase [Amycolatopsis bartoniae]TVT01317.1 thiolase family protein [Amycolatopsis bartoniae]GHF41372.1 acetyl-CoA acetyltransferase [Amycolatopsis bartoniae]